MYFLKKFLAGFVARQMGFPVELITVTNPNDIVSRTFKSGDWRMNKDVKATWASAMDIQVDMNYYLFMFYTLKYMIFKVRNFNLISIIFS